MTIETPQGRIVQMAGALALVIAGLVAPQTAAAQSLAQVWQGSSEDSGSLIFSWASLPQDYRLGFGCTAPSPQGLGLMETGSHESHRTDPYEMLISFRDDLFVWDMPYVQTGVAMIVGGVSYPLPPIPLDELSGTAIYLPMSAPLVDALYTAQSLALRTPEGVVHDFPVAGLARALDTALNICNTRWAQLGYRASAAVANRRVPAVAPAAPGIPRFDLGGTSAPAAATQPLAGIPRFNLPDGAVRTPPVILPEVAQPAAPRPSVAASTIAQLPPVIPQQVRQMCGGQARIEDSALRQAGDLDGDGAPDYIIHYTDVYCQPDNIRGFCGAANCSVQVFVSSRAYSRPFEFLALDVAPATAADGRRGLQVYGTRPICASGVCDRVWTWDGQSFSND
jgi:hypothetical protein